jgi:hypothetical protein
MKKKWKICCGGVVLAAGLASRAGAQAPPPPVVAAVPAAPVAAVPGAPVAAPAAAPNNIWTFLCLSPEQKLACKIRFCNSALGQMLNNGLQPVGAFSGGIIGPCCPSYTALDLAKPADSAEGAAARIKADEADAKARRAAVRYLGTVDCNYWPEAQDALINALRADRNECVRLEAAAALGHGCCCNRATIKALMLTVSGSTEDGNPAERSDRVRAWAHAALAHCLAVFCDVTTVAVEPVKEKEPAKEGAVEPPTPPEGEPGRPEPLKNPPAPIPPGTTGRANPVEYYRRAEGVKREQLIEEAKHLLERKTALAGTAGAPPLAGHSLADVFNYAMSGPAATPAGAPAAGEKPAAPAVTVEKAAPSPAPVEKPPAPMAPVWQQSPPATKPTPVTRVAPSPYSHAPTSYSPAPAPVAPVAHRDVPTTPAPSAAEVPPLRVPDLPPAPPPQGAPVPVAYMSVLQGSRAADQREWAAENLGGFDGWTNPRVVDALARAAREDASPLVRATCLRSLARMNVQTLPVLTTVRDARRDGDPRVRAEAEQALRQLGADDSGPAPPGTPAAMPK